MARRLYLFFLRLELEKLFSARVTFRPAYSFGAVRDVEIEVDDLLLTCQLFKPSWGLHTSFIMKKVWARNLTYERLESLVKAIVSLEQRISPSLRYFRIFWSVDEIILEDADRKIVFENVNVTVTNSFHTLDCKHFFLESKYADFEANDYHHDLHFNSKLPTSVVFTRPDCQVELDGTMVTLNLNRIVGFTSSSSPWRFDTSPLVVRVRFKGFGFSFAHSQLALQMADKICFEFANFRILCDGLECYNQSHDFYLRVTDLCMSMREVKVKYVMFKVTEMLFDLVSHLTSIPAVLASDRAELVLTLNDREVVNVATTNYRSDGETISFDEVRGEVITGNVSLAGLTGQKTMINKRSFAIDTESCALVYCNNEKSRRVLSLFFGFLDAHRLPIIKTASIAASRVLIEEAIEGEISILKDCHMGIEVKPMVTIEKAKPVLLSLFPKIPNIHSVRDVLSVRYSISSSEYQSAKFQMSSPRLIGMINFLMNEIQLQICGNVDVKATEATMNINQIGMSPYWLLSCKVGQLRLNIDKSTYLLVGLRGDMNEWNFDEVHLDKMLPTGEPTTGTSSKEKGTTPFCLSSDPLSDMFRMSPLDLSKKTRIQTPAEQESDLPHPALLRERKFSSHFELDDILNRPADHEGEFWQSPVKAKRHKKKKTDLPPPKKTISTSKSGLLNRAVCVACKSTQRFNDILSAFKGRMLRRRDRKKRNFEIQHLDGTKGEFRNVNGNGILKIQTMKVNNSTFSKAVVHYECNEPMVIEAVQVENDMIKAMSAKFVLSGQVFQAKTVIATPDKFQLDRIARSFGKAQVETFIIGDLSLENLEVEDSNVLTLKASTGFVGTEKCTAHISNLELTHTNAWNIRIQSFVCSYETSFDFLGLSKFIPANEPTNFEIKSGQFMFYRGQEEGKTEFQFANINLSFAWNEEKQRRLMFEIRRPTCYDLSPKHETRLIMSMKDSPVTRVKVVYEVGVIPSVKVRLPTVRLSGTHEELKLFMGRFRPLVSPVKNPLFSPWLFKKVFFDAFDVELTETDNTGTTFVEIIKIPETEIVNTKCELNVMIANIITTLDNTVKGIRMESDPYKDDEDITDQSISGTNKKSWLRRFKTFIVGGKNQDRV